MFPGHCRPDVIEFDNLKRSNAHYNLQNAFNVAEKDLGLTKLLDPEGEWVKPRQKHEAFLSQVTLTTLSTQALNWGLLPKQIDGCSGLMELILA